MEKPRLFLLLFLLCPFRLWAQLSVADTDSLNMDDETVHFRPAQLILPLSLVAVGAVGVMTPQLNPHCSPIVIVS